MVLEESTKLTGETVIQSLVNHIKTHMKKVKMWRLKGNKQVIKTFKLNIFTDKYAFDPNDESVYPYMFIKEYNISSRRFFNPGGKDKFYFTYSFAIAYYIDIRPTDLMRIPQINEEMRAMQRQLMIVLDRLDILGDIYHIDIHPPPAVSGGILHFFIQIPDIVEYVFPDTVPPVEGLDLDVELSDV